MTAIIVWRPALCCGVLQCGEVLGRYGECSLHGWTAIPVLVDDAEEIEVDLSGTPYSHKGSRWEPDDSGVEDVEAEFEGEPFPLTKDEEERATEILWEAFESRPAYDDSKDDERDWR